MYIPTIVLPGISSDKLAPYVYRPEIIPQVWDEMEVLLQRSFDHSFGMIKPEKVKYWLMMGDAVAFATVQGNKIIMVLVVMKVYYATYNSARIIACAGKRLKEAMQFIDALEAWAITEGCVEIEAWCRPAMVRLVGRLGWKPKVMIVSRDLRRTLQ